MLHLQQFCLTDYLPRYQVVLCWSKIFNGICTHTNNFLYGARHRHGFFPPGMHPRHQLDASSYLFTRRLTGASIPVYLRHFLNACNQIQWGKYYAPIERSLHGLCGKFLMQWRLFLCPCVTDCIATVHCRMPRSSSFGIKTSYLKVEQ